MTICEESFEFFGTTKFTTYTSFCNTFKYAMIEGNFSFPQKQMMTRVGKMLKLVYALDDDSIGFYINTYFSLSQDQIIQFEKVVRTMKVAYPMSSINK